MSELAAAIARLESLAADLSTAETKGWWAHLLDKATGLEAQARAVQILIERKMSRDRMAKMRNGNE